MECSYSSLFEPACQYLRTFLIFAPIPEAGEYKGKQFLWALFGEILPLTLFKSIECPTSSLLLAELALSERPSSMLSTQSLRDRGLASNQGKPGSLRDHLKEI